MIFNQHADGSGGLFFSCPGAPVGTFWLTNATTKRAVPVYLHTGTIPGVHGTHTITHISAGQLATITDSAAPAFGLAELLPADHVRPVAPPPKTKKPAKRKKPQAEPEE